MRGKQESMEESGSEGLSIESPQEGLYPRMSTLDRRANFSSPPRGFHPPCGLLEFPGLPSSPGPSHHQASHTGASPNQAPPLFLPPPLPCTRGLQATNLAVKREIIKER
ncbi:zinc finger and BTB domain-containing protein 7C [Lates japonicus]|uniref:Zinc finger and BTB domain-containing protein 7C n=1 Tax=Lates japonicus TaxID=270547 RepID=A0AAD3NIC4_LATJO|nr:zinc finger and BTB domain-containing protein 7C [Lates japonicus]